MRRLILTVAICLYSLDGVGQDSFIHSTMNALGDSVNYIGKNTYENITINSQLRLDSVDKGNSITRITDVLGEPIDIEHQKDLANDGTLIFQRKLITYPGMTFLYPQHAGYVMSKVEITTNDQFLTIGDVTLRVGMSIEGFKSILAVPPNEKEAIVLYIATTDTGKNNVDLGFKRIIVWYDSITDKITSIVFSIRYT